MLLSTQPVYLTVWVLQDPINKLERSDLNATRFKSFIPCHPPAKADKGSFVSLSTCLALHVPRCFVALCTHLFQGLSFSIFLCLFLHLSLMLPSFPLVICFSPVGFGIPFRDHIIQFLSFPEDGPRAAEWVTVGPPTPPHLTNPLFFPCHAMMSWLLFALGVHADSLPVLNTPYLPLPAPYPH